jgi:hypothetical protein
MGILIFKGLTALRLYKSFGVKGLSYHPHANNTLIREQYGFRRGRSTENPTFRLTERIVKTVNQIMHIGGTFGGSAKTYD